jgi:Xaa-Pro aminopeptidase
VYYLTGFWPASYHTPILYFRADGRATLAAPEEIATDAPPVDDVVTYAWQRLGTLIDDPVTAAFRAIEPRLPRAGRLAVDRPACDGGDTDRWIGISDELLQLRRAKDEDEVELIRVAVRGCEAAYARAAQILTPGVREIDIFAEMQAAAVQEIGEPIGEMGNDFQAGTGGGPPRTRCVQQGELMPLDVAVNVRGYRCDLCRTFVVGGEPSDNQRRAAERVLAALDFVEGTARAGISGRWLYETVRQQLTEGGEWEFPHHLGHGTGLSIHEAPRLNPHWDDWLSPGDLLTIEPGLYGEDLRGGVRIEEDYWLGPQGLTKLSQFPRGLVLPRA